MSGGGVNGAWEAGVLWGFLNYGDPKDFEWDVVSGVSAGCINAAGVGLWAKGTELEMVKWMDELWGKVKTADIYQSWPGGALLTGPFRQSFFDTAPGIKFFGTLIAGQHAGKTGFQKKVVCDAVDSETGLINALTEKTVPFD